MTRPRLTMVTEKNSLSMIFKILISAALLLCVTTWGMGGEATGAPPPASTPVPPANSGAFPESVAITKSFREWVQTKPLPMEHISTWLEALQPDGSWKDIDYTSTFGSGWQPSLHAIRTCFLAAAYIRKDGPFAGDPKVREAISSALLYWSTRGPVCPNWWHNEICVPKATSSALLLLKEELTPEERDMARRFAERKTINRAGQNGVWNAEVDLLCALILEDESLASRSINAIFEHVAAPRWEGLKTDYAFHQHGPQHQFGTYGMGFAESVSDWMGILKGSSYANRITPERREIFRRYLVDGLGSVLWQGTMDPSALGRQFYPEEKPPFSPGVVGPCTKAKQVNEILERMCVADPEYASQYRSVIEANTPGGENRLTGFRLFFQSDFAVRRMPDFYFSVRGSSTRIALGEGTRSENAKGQYLGDGATYLMRRGDEYRNIFPVWDWRKLPGITCPQSGTLPPFGNAKHLGGSPFVGGVTDGVDGVFAMELLRDGLSARKSWFLNGRIAVCLGAGISSQREDAIATTLNQCLLRGPVTLWRAGREYHLPEAQAATENAVDAITHDGITYLFPEPTDIRLSTGRQSGRWSAVSRWVQMQDDPVEKPVFLLWLDHGSRPANARYSYAICPAATATENTPPAEWRTRFKILANEPMLQAVQFGHQTQVVFWAPGELALPGGTLLKANEACVLMLEQKPSGEWQCFIADPTQQLKSATLSLGDRQCIVAFPEKPFGGQTVQRSL